MWAASLAQAFRAPVSGPGSLVTAASKSVIQSRQGKVLAVVKVVQDEAQPSRWKILLLGRVGLHALQSESRIRCRRKPGRRLSAKLVAYGRREEKGCAPRERDLGQPPRRRPVSRRRRRRIRHLKSRQDSRTNPSVVGVPRKPRCRVHRQDQVGLESTDCRQDGISKDLDPDVREVTVVKVPHELFANSEVCAERPQLFVSHLHQVRLGAGESSGNSALSARGGDRSDLAAPLRGIRQRRGHQDLVIGMGEHPEHRAATQIVDE